MFGAALAALIALAVLRPPGGGSDLLLALFVGVLVLAGRSVDFRISNAGSTHMGTPALLVGVLLLDPTLAVLAVAIGATVSDALQRSSLSRTLFNAGQGTMQAFLALGVLHLAGWDAAAPNFDDPFMLAVIAIAGSLAITASALLVSIAASIESGRPLTQVFVEVMIGGNSKLYLIDLSKICFGIIAAMLISWTPVHVLLIVIPLATMSHAIARSLSLSRRLEKALHETEDSLADAQSMAKLGSWEWELSSRYMRWSDQVFEITGLEQSGALVSLGDLRGLLRIPDRAKLERAVGRVLETHSTEEFDHEIRRADGSVRYVHHVMAWVAADERAGDRLVGTLLDITERKHLELELRHQAYHDGLTGLPNRELFLERLADCLSVARGSDPEKGVIFLDLDFFKQINDRFGHEAGDAVLVEIAHRLQRHVEPRDTVARLSGDEFTVLVCNKGSENRIVSLAGELLRAIQRPVHVYGESIPMTASAGLVYITERHQTPSDVLREADNALYRAKGAGRNRLSVQSPDPDHQEPTVLRTLA